MTINVLFLLTTPRAETTVISVSLATLSMLLRTCDACSSVADSRCPVSCASFAYGSAARGCSSASCRGWSRYPELDQLVDVADHVPSRIAQIFDAFRNVEDIRGDVVSTAAS